MANAEIVISARNLLSGPLAKVKASMEAARKSVEGLEQAAAKVRQLTELRSKVQASATAMRAAQDRVATLARQINAAERPSAALKRQFEQAKKAAAGLKTEYQAQQRALAALGGELRAAGVNTANLGGAQAKLRRQIADATRELERQAQRTRVLERAEFGISKIRAAGREIKDKIGGALRTVAVGAAAGAGFTALFNRFLLQPAAQFEAYSAVLETTEGSAQAAAAALDWANKFAAQTPYDLDQVTEAFVRMRAYGLDPMGGLLRTLGDTAAAMNKPLMQAVEAIADAQTGEFERLKEFGIKAMQQGSKTVLVYTDKTGKEQSKSINRNSRKQINDTLAAIWNEKYAGAMDRLSKTWVGMWSNLGDQGTRFAVMTMQSGLFDWMKGKLDGVLAKLNEMAANGKLQEYAQRFGTSIRDGLQRAWEVSVILARAFSALARVIERAATALGGYENLIKVLLALAVLPTVLSLAGAFMSLAKGLTLVGRAIPLIAGMSSAASGVTKLVAALSPLAGMLATLAPWLAAGAIAGAVGYGVGALVNKGLDALITKLRGKDASLGTTIYDWLHPDEASTDAPSALPARGRSGHGRQPPAVAPSQTTPRQTLATPRSTLAPARPTLARAQSQPTTPVAVGGSVAVDVRVKDERTTARVTRVETRNPAVPVEANVGQMLGAY